MGKWSTYRRRGRVVLVEAAPAPPSPPLDAIATVAFAGYSMARKLRAAYAGSAFRVRRFSDSVEQDIGFDGSGDVDLAALTAFIGASSGLIVRIYDQGLAGINMTTLSLNPPQVINSGVLKDINGHPASWSWSPTCGINNSTSTGFTVTAFGVFSLEAPLTTNRVILRLGGDDQGALKVLAGPVIGISDDGAGAMNVTDGGLSADTPYLATFTFAVGADSVALGLGSAATGNSGDLSCEAAAMANGAVQAIGRNAEFLIWSTALSAGDILTIQQNLIAYYGL